MGSLKYALIISLFFLELIALTGCFQEKRNQVLRSSDQDKNLAILSPSFAHQRTYIDDGNTQFLNTFSVQENSPLNFKIRGYSIHHFLQHPQNRSKKLCLVAHFPQSILALYLIPQREINLQKQTTEHYYFVQNSNPGQNQKECSKSSLVNAINNRFPHQTLSYNIQEVCSDCGAGLTGDPLLVYAADSGEEVTASLGLAPLRLQFVTENQFSLENPFCSNDRQCQNLNGNYNCCLGGQCVRDRAVKYGVDLTSEAFLQSRRDISREPSHIDRYPEFYYLCPKALSSAPSSDLNPDPIHNPFKKDSRDRLTVLKELYECTNSGTSEEGLCTISYPKASEQILRGTPFHTRKDARDFSHTWSGPKAFLQDYISKGTIAKIIYGNHILYDENHYRCMRSGFECFSGSNCTNDSSLCPIKKYPIASGACRFNPGAGGTGVATNDNLKDTQCVVINPSFAATSQSSSSRENSHNDRLDITYRVDVSCEPVSSALVRCQKYYVQGQFDQNQMATDDHSPHSLKFKIPSYADTSKIFSVFVDGLKKIEGTHWSRQQNTIIFQRTSSVFDGQRVRIEYYANIDNQSTLLTSRKIAQEKINAICGSESGFGTNLLPVTREVDGGEKIVDYTCLYPQKPVSDPPPEQVVVLDNRSVPVLYYDIYGVNHDHIDSETPAQEGRAFSYQDGDRMKPNNLESSVGFHEIYGTMGSEFNSPKPPARVNLKPGRLYHLYVESGQYSSCSQCGRDYYSALNRLFPDVYGNPGSGIRPDPYQTERVKTSRYSSYLRSDDFLFGRACFIPATMIPWSHRPHRKERIQRKNRQETQHFLFANGYQRDWYGFDYGSVIGSYDGNNWFSVGNRREIRAKSNKLYLAINAYFADLSLDGSHSVRISEVNHIDSSSLPENIAKSDGESGGAECQKYHQCQTDRDCITQLGWDYACEIVEDIKSIRPVFDDNGRELPDHGDTVPLAQLVHAENRGASLRRCIYRGRGSLCHPDYKSRDNRNSYAGYGSSRVNGCSANHWCAEISSEQVFNQKIARFAFSPEYQNVSGRLPQGLEHHSFGLGARVLGRPFDYNGNEAAPPLLVQNLSTNKVQGLCVPGRDPTINTSYEDLNAANPRGTNYNGDMVGNIGMTLEGNVASPSYYNSCPVLNEEGQLLQYESPATDLADPDASGEIGRLASRQNTTTNLLSMNNLISSFNNTVEEITLQGSRCLRTAGSTCFTDLDCSPSFFGQQFFQLLDPETDASTLGLNGYEIKFWQEPLICSQPSEKYSFNYDLKKNTCCRDQGLSLSIGSDDENSLFGSINTRQIAGYNDPYAGGINLDDSSRYTRTHTTFKDTQEDNSLYPILKVAVNDSMSSNQDDHPPGQFQTFATIAERTCCTGHWVREFHQDNGGGHEWGPERMQTLGKNNFACLNYSTPLLNISAQECIDGTANCDCSIPDNPLCYARAIPLREGERYNKFFSNLELTGIPQVLIQTNAPEFQNDGEAITCHNPAGGSSPSYTPEVNHGDPVPGTLNPRSNGIDNSEYQKDAKYYYKASDKSNFADTIKQIFSPDQVTCCLPPGSFISRKNPKSNCCGGNGTEVLIEGTSERVNRCCLPDYTNLTVFFNRYVSSMLKDLPSHHFDPFTGRPLHMGDIIRVARSENVCCSGEIAMGKAFSDLRYPGAGNNSTSEVRRFIQSNNIEDNINREAELYDAGQRWSTDVYCVPSQN